MARSVVAASGIQDITLAGLDPLLTAPNADGDNIPCGSHFLWVQNGGGAPITVTLVTPTTVSGLAVAEAGGSVPAAGRRFFGPFPSSVFAQPSDQADSGMVRVDYSSVTSVTRGVFKL